MSYFQSCKFTLLLKKIVLKKVLLQQGQSIKIRSMEGAHIFLNLMNNIYVMYLGKLITKKNIVSTILSIILQSDTKILILE